MSLASRGWSGLNKVKEKASGDGSRLIIGLIDTSGTQDFLAVDTVVARVISKATFDKLLIKKCGLAKHPRGSILRCMTCELPRRLHWPQGGISDYESCLELGSCPSPCTGDQ